MSIRKLNRVISHFHNMAQEHFDAANHSDPTTKVGKIQGPHHDKMFDRYASAREYLIDKKKKAYGQGTNLESLGAGKVYGQ